MVIKGTRLGLFVFLDHRVNMRTLVVLLSTLWLYARQLGKVLNTRNARQSKNFTEFPLKDYFKLLLVIDVRLEL